MSLRVLAGCLYVLAFAIYAKRDWFVSLCAAVWLMAVNQHPDMPRSMGGIQGFNLWNVLMLCVLLAWWKQRKYEGLVWDMPLHVTCILLLYFCIISVSFLRYLLGPVHWPGQTTGFILSEYFINCFKWTLPGLIFFDACRTRRRALLALFSILALYFLLSVQVVKHVPLRAAVSNSFAHDAYKLVQNNVGYNRVTLSMMLGGASWAVLSTLVLAEKRSHKWMILGMAGVVALAQALTGGRSGYVSWAIVGLILCLVRWRRLLPVIPVVILAIAVFLPGVRDRVLQGLGGTRGNIVVQEDQETMTSGRNIAWPYVIDKIEQSPLVGYGREAMMTAGIFQAIQDDFPEEDFAHPHNAYLEILLDSGIIGLLCVIPWYLLVLWHGFRLLLDRQDPLSAAVGGVACSLALALLVAAMGGQTFYPREGAVGMWAAFGLMLRLALERARSRETGEPLFGAVESENADGESIDDLTQGAPAAV